MNRVEYLKAQQQLHADFVAETGADWDAAQWTAEQAADFNRRAALLRERAQH